MPIQNFNFSHIREYCDVINNTHGSNNDNRHVIIKEQLLLKEHFVTASSLNKAKLRDLVVEY
jgi:hypothetical protein